jgi:hypothetical protein
VYVIEVFGTFVNVILSVCDPDIAPDAVTFIVKVWAESISHAATHWFDASWNVEKNHAVRDGNVTVAFCVNTVVHAAFFHVCVIVTFPPANGPVIPHTEFAATTSNPASNPESEKLVHNPIELSIPSVRVIVELLSNMFFTGILKLVFHQVNFVPLVLLENPFATLLVSVRVAI